MSEKIIHEVKLIETETGYRLEINGDKERIKQMGFGPGMFGFSPWMKRHGRRSRHLRHHGRHHGHHRGPWGWKWGEAGHEEEQAGDEPIKSA